MVRLHHVKIENFQTVLRMFGRRNKNGRKNIVLPRQVFRKDQAANFIRKIDKLIIFDFDFGFQVFVCKFFFARAKN